MCLLMSCLTSCGTSQDSRLVYRSSKCVFWSITSAVVVHTMKHESSSIPPLIPAGVMVSSLSTTCALIVSGWFGKRLFTESQTDSSCRPRVLRGVFNINSFSHTKGQELTKLNRSVINKTHSKSTAKTYQTSLICILGAIVCEWVHRVSREKPDRCFGTHHLRIAININV